MRKICMKCSTILEDATADDLYCGECRGELKVLPEPDEPSALIGMTGPVQQDNRIHKGDKIAVGGDNFNAQTVDNRTVTTNTTINNIQQIVDDDTKKLVECAISGKNVPKADSVRCPSCSRIVSLAYYVESELMCKQCYNKSREHAHHGYSPVSSGSQPLGKTVAASAGSHAGSQPDSKAIPPVWQSNAGRASTPVEPIRESGPGVGCSRYIYIIVAVLAVGAGLWWFSSRSGSETTVPEKDTVAVVQQDDPVEAPAGGEKEKSGTSSPGEEVKKATGKKVDEQVESPTKQVEVETDPFAEGRKAYQSGNYTKAFLMMEQSGSAAASYYLALMHQQGKGTGKDIRKAFSSMKKSAEGGYADAYFELAEMYRGGIGTESNRALAKQWYEKAVMADGKNADKAGELLNKLYK